MNFHFLLSLVHNEQKNYLNNDQTFAVYLACNTSGHCAGGGGHGILSPQN